MNIQKLIQDAIDERFKDAVPSMKVVMTEMAKYWANFALSLDRWQPIGQLGMGKGDSDGNVLFLFKSGEVRNGFKNALGELMIGNQGWGSTEYIDTDNPITHFKPLPTPPSQ